MYMDDRSPRSVSRNPDLTGTHGLALLTLLAAALGVRLVVFLSTVELPGDGPVRAIHAYEWARAPHLQLYGVWLPGLRYAAGIFGWIVPDPVISSRIFSLILGSFTIPVFYALTRRIYGGVAGMVGAVLLTFLPLHVGLSNTSLTESAFLFAVLSSMLLLVHATEGGSRQTIQLVAAVVMLVWAEMMRYEAWIIAPVFPLYYLFRTRRIGASIGLTVVLAGFPILWLLSNQVYGDGALTGFKAASDATYIGAVSVSLTKGLFYLVTKMLFHWGWVLPLIVLAGVVMHIRDWMKRRAHPDSIFYGAVLGIFVALIVMFAKARGTTLEERYCLLGLVMGLPFAGLALRQRRLSRWPVLALTIVLVLAGMGATMVRYRANTYLTRRIPAEMIEVSRWLRNGPYHDRAVLATKIRWQATYLPLYVPEMNKRLYVFSTWNKKYVGEFIESRKPTLVITAPEDAAEYALIAGQLGKPLHDAKLVYRTGVVEVYDLTQ